MKSVRMVAVAGLFGALAVIVVSATAWACIAGPTLDAPKRDVKPGESVAITGVSYNAQPVVVRFNALDGPVLATIAPAGGTAGSSNWSLNGDVPIPAETPPGNYVLVATQPLADGKLSQIPTRALVTVVGAATPVVGAPLTEVQSERPIGLEQGESVSTGAKVLVATGVAGLTLFVAGLAVLVTGRREDPQPAMQRTA